MGLPGCVRARLGPSGILITLVPKSVLKPALPSTRPVAASRILWRPPFLLGEPSPTTRREPILVSVLKFLSVKPPTVASYHDHFEKFQQWVALVRPRRLIPVCEMDVDQLMVSYFDAFFEDGRRPGEGEKTVAAAMFFLQAEAACNGKRFPRARRSLRGWRRARPGTSRVPLRFEVLAMIVNVAIVGHKWDLTLALTLGFELYLRPGEIQTIRVCDLVAPIKSRIKGRDLWSVVLHPCEVGVPSKTAEFDETLALDLDRHRPLGEALGRHAAKRPENECLIRMPSVELGREFRRLAQALKVDKLGVVHAYQLRHGGASHDWMTSSRDLTAIMRRGRWRSWDSVRRYEKGSRTNEVVSRLSAVQKQFADECIEHLPKVLCGKRLACLPPWLSASPWKSSVAAPASQKRSRSKAFES